MAQFEKVSDGSDGKESACNAGDLGLIPGSERSPGEGNGEFHGQQSLEGFHPWGHKELDMTEQLAFSFWASLVAQTVKNLPAKQEIWVQSLGQKDLLEKGMATNSSVLAWRIPWTEEPGRAQAMGLQS